MHLDGGRALHPCVVMHGACSSHDSSCVVFWRCKIVWPGGKVRDPRSCTRQQSSAAARQAGPSRRSSRDARRDLYLVHKGFDTANLRKPRPCSTN